LRSRIVALVFTPGGSLMAKSPLICHQGNCIGVVATGPSAAGDRVVSYTGLLRHGKMETGRFVVADQALSAPKEGDPAKLRPLNWRRAVTTNVDTFERT
jgi:hypothetical protein